MEFHQTLTQKPFNDEKAKKTNLVMGNDIINSAITLCVLPKG
jgi:hypothetical protein